MLDKFWRKTISFDTMIRQSRESEEGLPHRRSGRMAFVQPQVDRSIVNTLSTSTKSK